MRTGPGTFGYLYKRERKNLVDGVAFMRKDLRHAESVCQERQWLIRVRDAFFRAWQKVMHLQAGVKLCVLTELLCPKANQMLSALVKKMKHVHKFQSEWGEQLRESHPAFRL